MAAFHRVPAAHYADPGWGTAAGGTAAKLTGREFRDAGANLQCQFGSTTVRPLSSHCLFSVSSLLSSLLAPLSSLLVRLYTWT